MNSLDNNFDIGNEENNQEEIEILIHYFNTEIEYINGIILIKGSELFPSSFTKKNIPNQSIEFLNNLKYPIYKFYQKNNDDIKSVNSQSITSISTYNSKLSD